MILGFWAWILGARGSWVCPWIWSITVLLVVGHAQSVDIRGGKNTIFDKNHVSIAEFCVKTRNFWQKLQNWHKSCSKSAKSDKDVFLTKLNGDLTSLLPDVQFLQKMNKNTKSCKSEIFDKSCHNNNDKNMTWGCQNSKIGKVAPKCQKMAYFDGSVKAGFPWSWIHGLPDVSILTKCVPKSKTTNEKVEILQKVDKIATFGWSAC